MTQNKFHIVPNTSFGIDLHDGKYAPFMKHSSIIDKYMIRLNYDALLIEKPELWHFVPCDENNIPLPKPKEHLEDRSLYYKELDIYQKHLERCLFVGFELTYSDDFKTKLENGDLHIFKLIGRSGLSVRNMISEDDFKNASTIDDLTKYNLKASQSCIERIFGKQ